MTDPLTNMPTPDTALEMYKGLIDGTDQALPMLMYGMQDGTAAILALAGNTPEGGMQELVPQVLTFAAKEMGPPRWLMLSSEAWSRIAEPDADGNLIYSEDTPPMEVVMILGVSADEGWMCSAPFTRLGDGTVNWQEPLTIPPMGGLADILLAAVR